ncbi:hypothetical protein BD311DRAFT_759703 [Dichomitus squalens]|uniref:TPR-like protein n=1 Tax=Dichomitus squalens TaxID=114155 RepID=A0A4Q9MN49_9APHY|nr:hypothetical protein BD311DRAFT_759703 [Dichomitus squalens]
MPAKYSHTKKRPPPKRSSRKESGSANTQRAHDRDHRHGHNHEHKNPTPHPGRSVWQPPAGSAELERTISRIILIRYEQDIARLFSTHLYNVALTHLPTFVLRCITVGGPSWVAANADCDEIKDFFRGAIAMDLRQAGERVATKSVLWTYTALRHFAKSNGILICQRRGLHSHDLIPHHPALAAHLSLLESAHPPPFAKPPHLGPLTEGIRALTHAAHDSGRGSDLEWQARLKEGYERACATLWRVANEFDVRGYGLVLKEKLMGKWCECGCSTDHLAEVCEPTVRAEEEESGVRAGKEREWDGRGSGVEGWGMEEEEDLWDAELDHVRVDPERKSKGQDEDEDMTAGELMEWRYMCAEREKDQGNSAFKKGDYDKAIAHYNNAYQIEPELPHYQLNLAAAYLKLNNFVKAEKACDIALGQHSSVKGHWRRAQARRARGQMEEALKDLRTVLELQPSNAEALADIIAMCPPEPPATDKPAASSSSSSYQPSQLASAAPSHLSLWIPKHDPPAPLPFQRLKTDDRKLKISSIPITLDIPPDFAAFAASAGVKGGSTLGASGPSGTNTFQYMSWERFMVRKISD